MINDLKSSSLAANTAISSSQEAATSGIQKAAMSQAGIAAARDSFELAAAHSSVEINPTAIAQPAMVDEPVGYLNRANEFGKSISAYAGNQELMRMMSDANLDLQAGLKDFNDGFEKKIKDALRRDVPTSEEKRTDLQNLVKVMEEEVKKLQEQLEEASDKYFLDTLGSFFGDDQGVSDLKGISDSVDLSPYATTKKDDDDWAEMKIESILFGDLNITAAQLASSLRFANLLIAQGQYPRAENLLLRLVLVDPENPYVRALLGSIQQKQNQYEKAIVNYSKAISAYPEDINSLVNRGELYLHAGQLEKAAADLTKAIQLDPNGKHPSGIRARLLVSMALNALNQTPDKTK